MIKQKCIFVLQSAVLVMALCGSASANTCDMQSIGKRSIEVMAKSILDSSDAVGLGVVRRVLTKGNVEQQEVEIIVPAKGNASIYPLSPFSIAGVRKVDGAIRWFYFKPDEIHLFALRKTSDGYVTPTCLAAGLTSTSTVQLFAALSREAPKDH